MKHKSLNIAQSKLRPTLHSVVILLKYHIRNYNGKAAYNYTNSLVSALAILYTIRELFIFTNITSNVEPTVNGKLFVSQSIFKKYSCFK